MDQKLLIEAADILSNAESIGLDEGAALQQKEIYSQIKAWNKRIIKEMKAAKSLDEKKRAIGEYRDVLKKLREDAKKMDDDTVWSYLGGMFLSTKANNIAAAIIIGVGAATGVFTSGGISAIAKSFTKGIAQGSLLGNAINAGLALATFIAKQASGKKDAIREDTIAAIDKLISVCDNAMKVTEEDAKKLKNSFKEAGKNL